MIPKVSWMVAADTTILWWLSEHRYRFAVTSAVVATNVGLSQTHANRRMNILAAGGLVEPIPDKNGYYRISDLGERYIIGDTTEEELEALDPEMD